jgi:hypothetical protein
MAVKVIEDSEERLDDKNENEFGILKNQCIFIVYYYTITLLYMLVIKDLDFSYPRKPLLFEHMVCWGRMEQANRPC